MRQFLSSLAQISSGSENLTPIASKMERSSTDETHILSKAAFRNAKVRLKLNFEHLNKFLVAKILKDCGCRATFFRHYEKLFHYPDCMIFDHIFCVKEILQVLLVVCGKFFETGSRNSTPPCGLAVIAHRLVILRNWQWAQDRISFLSLISFLIFFNFLSFLDFLCLLSVWINFSKFHPKKVQYGYPSLTINAPEDVSINSVFIEMNSRVETTDEKPRYPFERFMSDVGGSIAFFLGFSAPTIIIFLEKLMINTMSTFQVDKKLAFLIQAIFLF